MKTIDKQDVLEDMIKVSSPCTEQGWREAGELGIVNNITVFDMIDHVTGAYPELETVEDRAEGLETMLQLLNAMYLVEKGQL